MSLLGKQSGPKLFVRLSKVSALEDVRLRQVLLYKFFGFSKTVDFSDMSKFPHFPLPVAEKKYAQG